MTSHVTSFDRKRLRSMSRRRGVPDGVMYDVILVENVPYDVTVRSCGICRHTAETVASPMTSHVTSLPKGGSPRHSDD